MDVTKTNLSELIVTRIREYIETNNLRVGDRLPTEQEMADMFGVSRISLREATKALNFLGIIRAAPRRGLTVGPVDMNKLTEILSFHFMLDNYPKELLLNARMVIEVGSLQYAMKAIIDNNVLYEKLVAICDRLDKTKDPEKFLKGDTEFHRTLVEASGVHPLLAFNDVISAFFTKFRLEFLTKTDSARSKGSQVHRKIIAALHDGDLIEAEKIMRHHLEVYSETGNSE
ncbi:MAG: FCD domain-containing protein [Sedimentisphaerales bacterium]|nr:FCD domain-containing protein [Sedimentisphaerales bacterium]